MTNRENCLLAYQHKTPAYIPCFFTDIALIQGLSADGAVYRAFAGGRLLGM